MKTPASIAVLPRCRFQRWLALWIVSAAIAVAVAAPLPAASATADYEPAYTDLSALMLLMSARNALAGLAEMEEPLERRIRCSTAVTALTGLYQLHGCSWALPALQRVLEHPDCPPLLVGYSLDGRLQFRLEPLELQRDLFNDYTIYLCTLSSQSALDLSARDQAQLIFLLADGSRIEAQLLGPEHPLWAGVERLAATFELPPALSPGTAVAFKQVFGADISIQAISAVLFDWGQYGMVIPNFRIQEGL